MDLEYKTRENYQPTRRTVLKAIGAVILGGSLIDCGGQGDSLEKKAAQEDKYNNLDLSSPEKTAQHYLRFRFQEEPDYEGLKHISLPKTYDGLRDFLEQPPKPVVEMVIEEENKAWFVEVRKRSSYRAKGENYNLPTAQVVGKIQLDKGTFSPFVNLIKKKNKWLVTSVSH